ncbi:MAG: ribonuclease BN [Legionellaceae bacterium]|nr:ribonuclease BN [Legionellaceae bacterium]
MFKGKSICVVIPAYNEARQIEKVITTMPDYVDRMVVVDDKSKDDTVAVVKKIKKSYADRLVLIEHKKNAGPGGAVATGYRWARDNNMEVTAVMAGDAQMDPEQLHRYIEPIVANKADYTKGNRLLIEGARDDFPKGRYLGSAILSFLTKIASGYWHVGDPQNGYTAISLRALKAVKLEKLYRRYGLPNIVLVALNIHQFRVCDIHTKPVYGVGEVSSIGLFSATWSLSIILFKCFFWRMKEKYIIRDFHPLVLFYLLSIVVLPLGSVFGLVLVVTRLLGHSVAATSALFAAFLVISGFQSLFFAMWFDMDSSRDTRCESSWEE